jgi:hypothetical protein
LPVSTATCNVAAMLVFFDESGDSGLRLREGSSRFFVVSLCIFSDNDEALDCDTRITELRKQWKLPDNFEFHFYNNSDRIRRAFLEAIAPSGFTYFAFVLNKDPSKLWGEGFKHKDSLYKATAKYVFENAKPYLNEAKVIIDKSGKKVFTTQLASYLKKRMNSDGKNVIREVKMQHSHTNNLIQVADYVAGVINRHAQKKKNAEVYRRYIAHKEMSLQIWPK